MEFDPAFREKLQEKLRANKPELLEDSLQVLRNSLSSYFRVVLDEVSSYFPPFGFDYDYSEKIIRATLKSANTPSLEIRRMGDNKFRCNEVKFNVANPLPEWGSPEQKQMRIWRENLEYECEDEFWSDEKNTKAFDLISRFPCFIDAVYPKEEIQSVKNKGFTYNVEGWLDFTLKLIEINFPDYQLDQGKSGQTLRFLKPVAGDLLFGFEFDKRVLINEIKTGDLGLPYYFNIVLLNESIKKTTRIKDYLFTYHPDIVSLGILGNPFFYGPCFPLFSFKIVEMCHDINDMDSMEPRYRRTFKELPDNTIQVIHPIDYGEKLKRHAFFYMAALKYSADGYLKYVEKSIRDTINEVA